MANKTAFGPISIASWFVIFNGSCSRRLYLVPALPWPTGRAAKIERPAAIIVFGCEATARDNVNASTDCAVGAFL
jgi:hypothetical protein